MDLGKYDIGFEELERRALPNQLEFYRNPGSARQRPFRIVGNLYYIGDKRVCSHLIDTGAGLIVFDAGFQHTIHMLIQSIWEIGFKPADIKYLILSHGHFDHFGRLMNSERSMDARY